MKLGLQGVSVLFSSGDEGVAGINVLDIDGSISPSCLNEEDSYYYLKGFRFSPMFPVNCPYITAGETTFHIKSLVLSLAIRASLTIFI